MTVKTYHCPECRHEFYFDPVALIPEQTVISAGIEPKEDHLLSADHVGKFIENFGNLMNAVSKDIGHSCLTTVRNITTTENHGFKIEFLLLRHPLARNKPE